MGLNKKVRQFTFLTWILIEILQDFRKYVFLQIFIVWCIRIMGEIKTDLAGKSDLSLKNSTLNSDQKNKQMALTSNSCSSFLFLRNSGFLILMHAFEAI